MAKNTMGKTRPQEKPYEIWVAGQWEWRVLKKWQADDRKPYARWFCAVKSPYTFGSYELGDCYAKDIMSQARCIARDYPPTDNPEKALAQSMSATLSKS